MKNLKKLTYNDYIYDQPDIKSMKEARVKYNKLYKRLFKKYNVLITSFHIIQCSGVFNLMGINNC